MRMIVGVLSVLSLALLGACGDRGDAAAAPERAPSDPAGDRPAIVFMGTSLTAGLGLDPDQAYPALIQRKIDSAGLKYRVVNAGVSGETSAGARRRAEWLLGQPLAVLVIETGANDGLRGLSPESLGANIQAIVDAARARQPSATILLVEMLAPPNLGRDYTRRFETVYTDLASRNGLRLIPFLLDGVAGVDSLNQPDGIHPTAAGQQRMAETVWKVLYPTLTGGSS